MPAYNSLLVNHAVVGQPPVGAAVTLFIDALSHHVAYRKCFKLHTQQGLHALPLPVRAAALTMSATATCQQR
jgi:hypothetical protein